MPDFDKLFRFQRHTSAGKVLQVSFFGRCLSHAKQYFRVLHWTFDQGFTPVSFPSFSRWTYRRQSLVGSIGTSDDCVTADHTEHGRTKRFSLCSHWSGKPQGCNCIGKGELKKWWLQAAKSGIWLYKKNMGHGNIEYLRLYPVILDMAGGCWRFQISLTLHPP